MAQFGVNPRHVMSANRRERKSYHSWLSLNSLFSPARLLYCKVPSSPVLGPSNVHPSTFCPLSATTWPGSGGLCQILDSVTPPLTSSRIGCCWSWQPPRGYTCSSTSSNWLPNKQPESLRIGPHARPSDWVENVKMYWNFCSESRLENEILERAKSWNTWEK